jgi:hypothetical protein
MAIQGDTDKPMRSTIPLASGQPADIQAPPPKSQDELLGILTRAIAEAVNLKIITVVSPVTLGGTLEKPTVAFDQSQKVGAIATCINLLDGDITTAMDSAYGSNADDPVRQYHEAQVKEAKEIVDRNLRTIADLIDRVWDRLS